MAKKMANYIEIVGYVVSFGARPLPALLISNSEASLNP